MTAAENAALAYWSEHRSQLRQSESQRAVLTNYVLAIAAAVSGFVVQHFGTQTLPLSVLIVLTGLYGVPAAAKYHERANHHLSQAGALTQVLVQSGDLADNDVILDRFRSDHYQKYPRLSRIRLHCACLRMAAPASLECPRDQLLIEWAAPR
jgi:hypothetical protein